MQKKVMLLSPKDYNFYNFRSELILKLVEMGYQVVLVCPYGNKIDFFTERGCRFIDITIDRRGKSVINDAKLMHTYKILFKKEKPDLVLTYTTKPSVYAGYVCGKMKIPCIINNAGLMETKGFFWVFMRMLYYIGFRKATCIMFQNSRERDVVEKPFHYKVPYRDIPGSGVNLNAFPIAPYPEKTDRIIFNFVARIAELKGIDEYLTCAEHVKKTHPEAVFRIYGEYDDDCYKARIEDLGKKGIVEYCGILLDMKPAIAEAHAVIHPSHYEGMTNVILEHSAMGRPCIGSDIPGVREAIEDKKTGYLFPVMDVDGLIRVVESFLELPYEKKKQFGLAARKKVEKEFDRECVTAIYMEEIEKVLICGE